MPDREVSDTLYKLERVLWREYQVDKSSGIKEIHGMVKGILKNNTTTKARAIAFIHFVETIEEQLGLIHSDGVCCGRSDFDIHLLYKEGFEGNDIITDIRKEETVEVYENRVVVTFYGENLPLAKIDGIATSESCQYYGG